MTIINHNEEYIRLIFELLVWDVKSFSMVCKKWNLVVKAFWDMLKVWVSYFIKNKHDILNHLPFFIHRYINVDSEYMQNNTHFKMALHQVIFNSKYPDMRIYECIYHNLELYVKNRYNKSEETGDWTYFYLLFGDTQIKKLAAPFYALNRYIREKCLPSIPEIIIYQGFRFIGYCNFEPHLSLPY